MAELPWTEIVTALLGGGGLGAIVTALVRAKTVDRQTAARLAELENERADSVREAALKLVDDMRAFERSTREETGQHHSQYIDCEKRCARLEAENRTLRERVDELERDVQRLRAQVAQLLPEALKGYARDEEGTVRLLPKARGER